VRECWSPPTNTWKCWWTRWRCSENITIIGLKTYTTAGLMEKLINTKYLTSN
jgi:hypothetical protein